MSLGVEIPQGWRAIRFGDCAELINGRAYGQSELLESGKYKVIRIQNLNGGTRWYYSDLDLSEAKYCEQGDLLFAWSATFGPYIWNGEKSIFHYHIWKVLPRPEIIDRDFAFFLLLWITARIKAGAHGVAMLHFTKAGMEQYEVHIPPLSEQRQIAARLKAQLAEVETARRAAQMQLQEANILRRNVRQAGFDSLLKRYGRNACMKDVCRISAGGTPNRGNAAFFNGDIPWVKTLDLNFGVVVNTEEKISQAAFTAIRGKIQPIGTVMVAMYGGAGTIGKSGILGVEACTNQAVCSLQPDDKVLSSEFLHEWICHIRPEWMRLSGGNRKDPNINKSVVENMTLPLPPLNIQQRFVTDLKSRLIQTDTLRNALSTQLTEINRLPQRLLAQAFQS